MAFTKSTTDISVHQKLSDYPNQDDGLTAEQLKERFDFPAETLQTDLNTALSELEAEAAAGSVGASTLSDSDTSDGNVQAKLKYLYDNIAAASTGVIADGSVTRAKMNDTYANTLAVKDGTLQSGLNAEKLSGKTLAEIKNELCTRELEVNESMKLFTSGQMSQAGTWAGCLKNEAKVFDLSNFRSRHIIVSVLISDQNFRYVFSIDLAKKLVFPLSITGQYSGVLLSGTDYGTATPTTYKTHSFASSSIFSMFAFTDISTSSLSIQFGTYNTSTSSTLTNNIYSNVYIDVYESLALKG